MAKAIKHITAGLLHVEVIGEIPPELPGRRRRASRSQQTSPAQQFYNNKCSWRELELIIAANFGARDWVITYTYDDAHLPADKQAAGRELQKYFRKARAVRRLRGEELRYVYNIEGYHSKGADDVWGGDGELEDCRIHHHVIINGTGPGCVDELRSLWHGGGYIRAEPLDVHYYSALAQYMTKEAREFGRPKPGERTWRASRNLAKYEVEYIEIPSSSVTLAPPPGAVDYQSFREHNPYGFADCVGARYLLYKEADPPDYTYTRGRRRAGPNNFCA